MLTLFLLSTITFAEDDTTLLTMQQAGTHFQEDQDEGPAGFGGSSSGGFGGSSSQYHSGSGASSGFGGGFGEAEPHHHGGHSSQYQSGSGASSGVAQPFEAPPGASNGFGEGASNGFGEGAVPEGIPGSQQSQYSSASGGFGGDFGFGPPPSDFSHGFASLAEDARPRAGFVQFHSGAHVARNAKQASHDGHNPWALHSKPFDSKESTPPANWRPALAQLAGQQWGSGQDADGSDAPWSSSYGAPDAALLQDAPLSSYGAPGAGLIQDAQDPPSGYGAPSSASYGGALLQKRQEITEAGEYSAAAVFSAMAIDLSRHGAPPGLIIGANQAAMDEIKHAHSMLALGSHFSGKAPPRAFYTPMAAEGSVLLTQNLTELSKTCYDTMRNEAGTITSVNYVRSKLLSGAPARQVLDEAINDETRHVALFWSAMRWATEEGAEVPASPLLVEMDVSPSKLTADQLALMQWAGLAQGQDWQKSANLVDKHWTTPWLEALRDGTDFPDVVAPSDTGALGVSMSQMAKLVKDKVGHQQFAQYTGWPGLRK